MLEPLGLGDADEKVYRAVLSGPVTPVSGLAARTGLPETQVHASLEALTTLNLVRASADGCWEPVDPARGLAAIAWHQQAELAQQGLAIAAAYSAVAAAYSTANPLPSHLEPLPDLAALRLHAQDLASSAKDELQVTVGAREETGEWLASLLDGSWLATGVKVKVLCHVNAYRNQAALFPALLAGTGPETRAAPGVPPLLMISDQQSALVLAEGTHPSHGTGLRVREPAIVAVLASLFFSAWNAATPLDATAAADSQPMISAQERALLQQLAEGLTVETAARRLQISARTAARHIAALMAKLGTSSLFQAGHEATRRGLL